MTEDRKVEIREQLGVILLAAVLVMSGLLLIKQKDAPPTFISGDSNVATVESNEKLVDKDQPNSNKQTGLVNINTASLEDLDTLPGIGEKTAQKIIDYRDLAGGFKTKEELMEVSGIGEAKYEAVKELISF